MPRRTWYVLMNALILGWAAAAAVVAFVHRFVPSSGWMMVHLTLLGAASTAILIWSQHFADTLLRHQAFGGRRAHGIRLVLHTFGAIGVVSGILARSWPLVVVGAALVVLVAILHSASLTQQMRTALPSRFGPLVKYYIAAALALVVGVILGVLMARPDGSALAHDRLYLAHITFNVLGWIGLTVLGTIILLWPTILHARILPKSDGVGGRALPLLVAGLALVGLFSVLGLRIGVTVGLAVYLAGIAMLLREAIGQARQAPPSTYAGWSMGAAMLWLFGCVTAMAVLVAVADSWSHAASSMNSLVLPFVVGFVAQIVAGALTYLLPVVLGGGPSVTKRTNRELDRGGLFRVTVINAGLLMYLLPLPSLVRLSLSLLVYATGLAFLVLGVRAVIVARRASGEMDPTERPRVRPQVADGASAAGLPANEKRTRSGMLIAAAGAIVLAVVVGVALDPAGAGIGVTPSSTAGIATGHTTSVQMTMKDMRFHPDLIKVPVGDRLVIELTNADSTVHDLVLASGATSSRLAPGAKETVDAGIIGKDLDGWCSVTGHKQMGMVFTVVTTGTGTGTGSGSGSDNGNGHSMGDMHSTGPSAAADIDLMRKPAPAFTARDAALKPASANTVHKVMLTVSDTVSQVAPGATQRLWTYNGTAPGPTLRGHVGDKFEITLVNDGSIGHSIDFHAGSLAPDKPMRTIAPGEQLTYNFTATRSGIWLYHCSTMPMSVHIANGMFGAVIIDPAGLAPVNREYIMVQSEFYLGVEGGIVDAEKVVAGRPDLVVFNGYANQYVYRPLQVKVGERVRVWVLDAGPTLSAAFHIVGGQFDTVFKEGEYQLKHGGSTGTGGAQVLDLAAAQGGFVELTFPEAGHYSFVNHSMIEAERGASGEFAVSNQGVESY